MREITNNKLISASGCSSVFGQKMLETFLDDFPCFGNRFAQLNILWLWVWFDCNTVQQVSLDDYWNRWSNMRIEICFAVCFSKLVWQKNVQKLVCKLLTIGNRIRKTIFRITMSLTCTCRPERKKDKEKSQLKHSFELISHNTSRKSIGLKRR